MSLASVAPLARATDSVTLTPSLVTATAVGGGALPNPTPPTLMQGSTLYIYGSAQAAVYTINFNVLANLAAGEGFGSVAANFTTSSGITTPVQSDYTADTSSVWTFTLPGNTQATVNNTYNGTNLVASIGPYTSADATRSAFAQSVSAPVGTMKFQWNGTTNNATVKLNDTTLDGVLNQISYSTVNLSTGVISGGAFSGGQIDVQFVTPVLGDADLNGTVDFNDFVALSQNYGKTGGWSQGNFLGDPTVDFNDFVALSQNYHKTWTTGLAPATASVSAAISTPEPASLGILAIGAASLLARRKNGNV